MNITFPYPLWFLGLCLLLGLVYAFALYWRDNTFKDASKGQRRTIPLLALLRFLGGSAIAALILGPLMKQRITQVQKPSIVVAVDNSESIVKGLEEGDSTALFAGINNLTTALGEDAEVHRFVFDQQLKEAAQPDFTGKSTNLSGTFEELYNRFGYQNVGAIIMATDGIYNEGSNPAYSNVKMDIPFYTIALGDTTPARDLKIEKVLHNQIAYQGDKFTIRVDVSAFNCQGNNSILNVYAGKGTANKVFTKTLNLKDQRFFTSEDVVLSAATKGIQRFTVSVSSVKDELTTANNSQTIYVEVLEGRQKILVLANSPHPDITALKQAIDGNKNYESKVVYIKKFNGQIGDYDLAILHGLPNSKQSASTFLDKAKAKNLPLWFISSLQTDMNMLNKAQDILEISGANKSANSVQPVVDAGFGLFNYDPSLAQLLEEFPPLQSPFGEYKASPTAQTFMNQKIGSVETNYPLLLFQQSGNNKSAVLSGEGLWRWRMYDFMKNENYETVDDLISKTIQYLAVKNDKRQFRVTQPKNLFNENENITFDAELYNDSYELINEPEANLRVLDDEGKEYPYAFSKTDNAYTLDAGILPVGDYRFTGRSVFNGKDFTSNGNFTIRAVELEAMNTTADHNLLQLMSENYGGEMVGLNGIGGLADKILQSDTMKPVQYNSFKTKPIINLRWLFFLLLAMLSIEWFMRKYNGAY